tara:strand:+ start:46570 stop:46713 length:144 start_codon:yes stop_codon:yes gene_type:complete
LINVLAHGALGGGELHCQPSNNVDRSTAFELKISAPIAANELLVAVF